MHTHHITRDFYLFIFFFNSYCVRNIYWRPTRGGGRRSSLTRIYCNYQIVISLKILKILPTQKQMKHVSWCVALMLFHVIPDSGARPDGVDDCSMGRDARGVVISHDDTTRLYRLRRNNNKQEMRGRLGRERRTSLRPE
jgi:hypothetical protein